eukprot:TRINITY_DN7497_c0_g1_i2.p1 TRINITY_DN7497_c0_g1~~TRINITY_DN7497_c0_g1_i2.p1  ORF type:complete len:126 (+),score=12.73 TRINITY_DN7497_c0_g1_i2:40-417(+)
MLNNIENIVFKSMNTFVIQLNISKHKMTYILQYIVYKDSNVFKSLTKDHYTFFKNNEASPKKYANTIPSTAPPFSFETFSFETSGFPSSPVSSSTPSPSSSLSFLSEMPSPSSSLSSLFFKPSPS